MAANDSALQNGTEKLSTNALSTVNGVNVAADVIEVQRMKVGFGSDGALRDVDATNGLPIVSVNNSLVSTLNSTTTNLALNAVFTGTGEDISEYSTVFVNVFADQASATDGLRLEFSGSGAVGTWDFVDVYSIPLSSGKLFSVGVEARFFRIVYTNGAVATTAFRLQVLYSKNAKKSSAVRPQDGRTNDNDFEENLAFGMVYNGTTWDRLRGTIASGLTVSGSRLNAGTSLAAGNTHLTVGGSDGTNLRQLSTDTTGRVNVNGVVTGAAAAPLALDATLTNHTQRLQATTLAVTVTAAANTAATASLPAVAAQFHYITGIEIMRTSTAALAGTATLVVTTTNLPGSLAWSFGNVMAAGATQRDLFITFASPIKSSSANVATTIVMPAPGAAVLWRANVYYYTAA